MEDKDNGLATLYRAADAVQGFLETGLVPVIYETFWKSMPDPIQASCYLTVLITKWLALETADPMPLPDLVKKVAAKEFENPSDQAKLLGEDSELRNTILMTVYFIALYYPFESTFEPLKAAIGRWVKLRARSVKSKTFADECLRMLGPGYLQGKDGISNLVEQGSRFSFTPDFAIDAAPVELVAPCFINTYLRSMLLEARDSRAIFDNVLLFLSHPKLIVEPSFLLSLLHMLRTFISISASVDLAMIENALASVRNYYLWPCPYGDVARELLQLLTVELKSPGSALITKYLEENPELERGYEPTGKERTVHILLDDTTEQGKKLQQILQSSRPEEVSIHQMQVTLLTNILETNLKIDCSLLGLEYCSREDTASFYYTAIGILNQAVLMGEKDAIGFRQQKLTVLKDLIISRSTNNRRTSVSVINVALKNTCPPPLVFDFLPLEAPNEPPPQLETDTKYPHRTSADILFHILKQYNFKRNKPVVVKIGIAGNDKTLHDVVGSYICLRAWKPTLFDNLQLQFYILPVEHSNLATFLAKNDAWYGRHVYCLSHCILHIHPTIVPKSRGEVDERVRRLKEKEREDNTERAKKNPNKPPTPSNLLRTELQNYFREANFRVDINIYQMECYAVGGQFLYTIPFYQKAIFGYDAQARAFLAANNIPWDDKVSLRDLESKVKAFKYVACQVGLKFLQMNVSGQPRQGPTLPDKSYHTIVLSNIPAFGDRCTPPDPTKPWLEMYTLDADRKKKTKVSDEHVYHVSQVELEIKDRDKRKDGFCVLLDSVLYGPFEKVKFSMCLSPPKEDREKEGGKGEAECHSLPVMTYFPLVL